MFLFLGLTVDQGKSIFSISKPGAYYLSYNLILKTNAKATFTGAVILERDELSGATLKSVGESNGESVELSGAGVLRLTVFNSISIGIQFNKTNNESADAAILQPGSTFTVALVTTAGAVPGFSFKLELGIRIEEGITKELGDWSTGMKGAFHISVGFLPSRSYVQAICDGVYMLSVNLVLKGISGGESVVRLMVNQFQVRDIQIVFDNTTLKTKTLNIHQIINLYKSDIVKITILSKKKELQVLQESTYSMVLVNKISQHTNGFHTRLRSNFSVSSINKQILISGWPTDFNEVTEFKSPSTFSQLVNNRDFSSPQRGIYLITANLKIQWGPASNTNLTISLYSQPSQFALIKKTVSRDGYSNLTDVSLTTTAELERTDPVSVAIENQNGHVLVLPGSSFSAVQLPIYYPGILARLTAAKAFSQTGWKTINGWKTDQIHGGYDFLSGVNSSSGKYRIPNDGLYIVSAVVIVEDLEEVEALITNSKDLRVENGIFTKVGNPTSTMTINVGGIMQLKKADEVFVAVNSPSDTDWSIKGNTGFSVAYIGQNSHAFRAQTQTTSKVLKIGWVTITNWQAKLHFGGSFTSSSGTYVTPVSGVYYSTAIVILGNADSTMTGSQYALAIMINGVQVTGLYAHMSGPKTVPNTRRYYPLFLSGSFNAKKGDVVTLAVYSSQDSDYNIFELSSWSLCLLTENNDASQTGFSTSKNLQQNFLSTLSNTWYSIDNWKIAANAIGSFYTPSSIHFDDGKSVTIQTTGFYFIAANIYIQREASPSVIKLALFIQGELQQNGITYENIRKWDSFTLHLSGVAFLMQGDVVKLMISSTAEFDGLMIFKDSAFTIVMLPIAERFPGASLISMVRRHFHLVSYTPFTFAIP